MLNAKDKVRSYLFFHGLETDYTCMKYFEAISVDQAKWWEKQTQKFMQKWFKHYKYMESLVNQACKSDCQGDKVFLREQTLKVGLVFNSLRRKLHRFLKTFGRFDFYWFCIYLHDTVASTIFFQLCQNFSELYPNPRLLDDKIIQLVEGFIEVIFGVEGQNLQPLFDLYQARFQLYFFISIRLAPRHESFSEIKRIIRNILNNSSKPHFVYTDFECLDERIFVAKVLQEFEGKSCEAMKRFHELSKKLKK